MFRGCYLSRHVVDGVKPVPLLRMEGNRVTDTTASTEHGPTPLTDLGNCERFAEQHGHHVKYVHAWNIWLVWNGRYWEPGKSGEVVRLAKLTVRSIYSEASGFTSSDESKNVAAWANSSQSKHRLSAMLDLFRKRFVVVSETDDGARLNEGLVKSLTGGEVIRARRMRENNWEFTPTHTLLLVTNHRPVVKGRDVGIWRRLRIIPFDAQIAAEKQDAHLAEKLRAEYPAILQWMVAGCLDWQQGGLREPREVLLATDEYKTEQDVLGSFVEECCMIGNSYRIKSSTLYQGYRKWAETSGEKIDTQRSFGTKMTERGFERIRNNGIWHQGLTLNEG